MKTFELQGHEFIELNKLLKLLDLVSSGGEANQCILDGMVQVNGQPEIQKRKKLRPGDEVTFQKHTIRIQ